MNNYTLINKKFLLSEDAKISISERLVKFGDGVFETLKIYNSKIYDFHSHLNRLKYGLKALEIYCDISKLEEDSYQLIKKNKIKNGILRISISRGIGSMGYLPKDDINSLIIIETFQERKPKRDKITLGISDIKVSKKDKSLQGAKLSSSPEYILAKIKARKKGNFDDIMLNHDDFISECSSSNLFYVKNGKIYTPSMNCDLLPGTIREKLIKEFQVNIDESEAKLSSLKKVEEIFITNSNLLILPVCELKIDDKIIKLDKKISLIASEFINSDLLNHCK